MTDYLYSLSLAKQTGSFLLSLGFGFIMGIFYDLFRLVRTAISKGKRIYVVFDVLYCAFSGFCSYLFFLAVNEGEIRAFLIMGELMGFGIYYFSLGVLVFSAGERLIMMIKKLISSFFRAALFPFKWIFKKVSVVFNKIFRKTNAKGKKIKNKSKFLLKLYKHLLYNLNVKMVKNGVSEEKEV